MKVPEYIRKKMRAVALHTRQAMEAMDYVESWLRKNGLDPMEDGLRDGSGCSLEELEYGNDISDALCERIEDIWPRVASECTNGDGGQWVRFPNDSIKPETLNGPVRCYKE